MVANALEHWRHVKEDGERLETTTLPLAVGFVKHFDADALQAANEVREVKLVQAPEVRQLGGELRVQVA